MIAGRSTSPAAEAAVAAAADLSASPRRPGSARRRAAFAGLIVAALGLFFAELALGTVRIPPGDLVGALFGRPLAKPAWVSILWDLRLPRAITAALGGAGLAVAGLALQTMFRNPLAGPWALGATAGAQVGVALLVVVSGGVAGGLFDLLRPIESLSLAAAAAVGAAAVLALVLVLARKVGAVTLLVVGLLLGYAGEGLASLALHFTDETRAKVFASWNDGSFGNVGQGQLGVLAVSVLVGLALAFASAKPLDALLLGDNYARSLGVETVRVRRVLLAATLLLAASTTAFCGVVIFLDLAVPHLARGLFATARHRVLIPATALLGAALALAADLVVHLAWDRHFLHLNAVLAMVGAPVVLAVILRARRGTRIEG